MGCETPNITSNISTCHHMHRALSWAWHAHAHYAPSCRVKQFRVKRGKINFIENQVVSSLHRFSGSTKTKHILKSFGRASIKQTSIIRLIWAIMLNKGLLRFAHNAQKHFVLKTDIPLWWFILKYFLDTGLLNQRLKSERRRTLMIIVMSSNASQPWWRATAFTLLLL